MSPRKSSRPRLALFAGLAIVGVIAGGAYGALNATGKPQWTQRASGSLPQASASAQPEPSQGVQAAAAEAITLAATGDNVMGGPGNWPANNAPMPTTAMSTPTTRRVRPMSLSGTLLLHSI